MTEMLSYKKAVHGGGMRSKEILCTIGPSSLNERVIARLEELGVNLFRINLSHTKLQNLAETIQFLKSRTKVPICLDSEGAQIRTGIFSSGEVEVTENSVVQVHRQLVPGDSRNFNFYPENVVEILSEGDFISIDFNSVLAQVISKDSQGLKLRILNGGKIGSNKAVTVERDCPLPVMTQKDRQAFEIGRKMGISHVALSFANHASDVDEFRAVCGKEAFLISKIECRNGLINLKSIAEKSDAILIDRGDLSRQEPLERIPRLQKIIIKQVKDLNKKVYVATNLLESMVTAPKPTRAEVNDVINTLMDGADGLVLAAETAIGKDPVGCASMIVKLIHEHDQAGLGEDDSFCNSNIKSLLVEPHGGRLVCREASSVDTNEMDKLKKLTVSQMDLMDCEQIALGTYSPLTGFMDEDVLSSVLETNRLPNGIPWTLPVILQVDREKTKAIGKGERIALADTTGEIYALMDVTSLAFFDPKPYLKKWFGTDSSEHPGVCEVLNRGECLLAGDITLIKKLPSPYTQYQLTPVQSRFVFMHKGWSRVVGFHTRNVIHRAHEYIQMKALERTHADGLYVSPVIGPRRRGDFLPEAILKSYQMMIDFGLYPPGKVLIGCFMTYPRFCGPREAVFTAICRKNMGCSHFIIGRNHSGVGDFYKDEEYKRLFDGLGDIGVVPVFFGAIGYDPQTRAYEAMAEQERHLEFISGTKARESLLGNQSLPDWYMRDLIQNMLRADIQSKEPVFSS